MFIEIAATSFLVGQFIYHRWIEDKPVKRTPPREIQIPRVDPGATMPLIYGRCRVRAPILAWIGSVRAPVGDIGNGSPDAANVYQACLFFVLGIPFAAGDSTSGLHGMWAGDTKFEYTAGFPLAELPTTLVSTGTPLQIFHGGNVEVFDGDPAQTITSSAIWLRMTTDADNPVDADAIPEYRGYISVGLTGGVNRWQFGEHSTLPSYSFEASSYDTENPYLSTYARIGSIESNPINALYDLLTSPFGGLGLSSDLIDIPSFQAAAATLYAEWHGYSRCIEDAADAEQHIMEILAQIDGALRHNTRTNKIEIKLIRNDYDPTAIPHIIKTNGTEMVSFAASGWDDLPNKVLVIFPDRGNDYQERQAADDNQVSASLDASNPLVLTYPGVCYETLAQLIAKRETAARSRPLIKMRVYVGREFLRVAQGDAVKVTWTNPDIAGLVFRVANVEHGTLEDGRIALDLIQDYFYVHRNQPPQPPTPPQPPNPPIDIMG